MQPRGIVTHSTRLECSLGRLSAMLSSRSPASRPNIEAALRCVGIFKALSDRQIAKLAKLATEREFPAETRILRRGDTGMALYVVESGRVAVTVQSEEGGPEQRLAELGPGNVFGEMALIDGGPRAADVTALEV